MSFLPSIETMKTPEGFSDPGQPVSPYTITLPVAWGEMDSLGHVNNAVYLRWFETVRFHYFELVGMNALHEAERKGPILARADIDFLSPIEFPDQLFTSAAVFRLGNSSFTMRHRVWSTAQGRLCAQGDAVIVMVDYGAGGKSVRVPEPIRAAIRALEGAGLEEAR